MKTANATQIEIVNQILNRAMEDSKFKNDFVQNPKSVIEELYGHKVKNDIKLVVEDQSDENTIYINLPRNPQFENLELTEEELEKVSGGSAWACLGIGLAGAALYDFVDGFVEGFSK